MPDDASITLVETHDERVSRTRWGAYTSEVERRAIIRAHDLSGKPGAALDIGADGGRWSRLLADRGWKMTCTGIDAVTLALCKQRVPEADCVLVGLGDDRLPLETESASMVLCIGVPGVIQADWFVSEASRVLQNGGLVVGVFWNITSLRGLFVRAKALATGGHRWYQLSYPRWRRKLLRSGFSMLYEEGYCWMPFSRSSNSRLIPGLTRAEEWLGLRRLTAVSPWIVFIARKS